MANQLEPRTVSSFFDEKYQRTNVAEANGRLLYRFRAHICVWMRANNIKNYYTNSQGFIWYVFSRADYISYGRAAGGDVQWHHNDINDIWRCGQFYESIRTKTQLPQHKNISHWPLRNIHEHHPRVLLPGALRFNYFIFISVLGEL